MISVEPLTNDVLLLKVHNNYQNAEALGFSLKRVRYALCDLIRVTSRMVALLGLYFLKAYSRVPLKWRALTSSPLRKILYF